MRKREKVEIMIREAIPADAKDIIAFSRKMGLKVWNCPKPSKNYIWKI